MHNDEPALLDTLERGELIKEVGDAIAGCKPPQVFGVHGDWGLGKTSFLHQVQWYLTGDCPQQPEPVTDEMKRKADTANEGDEPGKREPTQKGGVHPGVVQAVWFDAWRYQNEPAPVVALLHEMRAQLSWRSRAAGSASRTAEVLTRGALLSLEELTKKIGFQYSKFRQANREWEAENLAATLPSHTLREHLCEAIRQLLSDSGDGAANSRRLVVFIDDVDRCEPEAAYRLLEGLKIYLTLDNCVFVLGMNQKAIEEAIAQRMRALNVYEGSQSISQAIEEAIAQRMRTSTDARPQDPSQGYGNPAMRAAAYMEKLCQNVWRIPAVRRPERVLSRLLEETVESESIRELVGKGLEVPRPGERSEESRYQCLPPNPRRLKGLANLIGRLSPRLPSREAGLSDDTMVLETRLLLIVAYIYQFHHDLHVRWEADLDLYNRVHDWCVGAGEKLPFESSLSLPLTSSSPDAVESGSSREMGTTYPDPTQASVFWIQPLILHIGNEIAPQRFARYLHGEPG